MPEGDTVWQTARRLDLLCGAPLTECDLRFPAVATVDLTGRPVVASDTCGKHLLTEIDGGLVLHSHLRMDGRWVVRPRSEQRPGPSHQVRAVLANDQWRATGLRLGALDLLDRRQVDQLRQTLGPDLVRDDADLTEAVRRFATWPESTVAEALLDQRLVAGLGTVYRAETLFVAGVSPFARVRQVDIVALVGVAHRLLSANRERFGQVTTGDRRPGHQHWVYGRSGWPCRRCGTRIRTTQLGAPTKERVVHWCPRCQPEPSPA